MFFRQGDRIDQVRRLGSVRVEQSGSIVLWLTGDAIFSRSYQPTRWVLWQGVGGLFWGLEPPVGPMLGVALVPSQWYQDSKSSGHPGWHQPQSTRTRQCVFHLLGPCSDLAWSGGCLRSCHVCKHLGRHVRTMRQFHPVSTILFLGCSRGWLCWRIRNLDILELVLTNCP